MIRYHENAGHIEAPGIAEADEFIAPAPRGLFAPFTRLLARRAAR
jgi:hypothetical protein